jgi:Domain of unknown function (DUF222)/HNH endonuclease
MRSSDVEGQVRAIGAVRGDGSATPDQIRQALRDVSGVRAWLASSEAALTKALAAQVSFPERDVADCTRGSLHDAIKTKERSDTLDRSSSLADALDRADITAGHVDEVTKTITSLDSDEQRSELIDRVDGGLLDVAAAATLAEWRRRLAMEAKAIRRDDGVERLERQRRATRLRTWTDGEGMVCLSGRFDPITGRRIIARLDATTQALFAEATPDTCPTDPVEKQRHLQGLALARLACGEAPAGRSGRPEYVVVVDSSSPDGAGGPAIDFGLPVEVPYRVVAEMAGDGNVHAVVVRNGVVLHAPGELDLGQTTRLANPAQRRALRALYRGCAIPGCGVRYDRCKLHHVTWWRRGGRTDLANLLPLCTHHHTKVHDAGWDLTLGPNRELTIRFPDGTVHNTGPPTRRAA